MLVSGWKGGKGEGEGDELVETGWLLRGTEREYWAPAAPMNVTWTAWREAPSGVGRALAAVRTAAAVKRLENLIVND